MTIECAVIITLGAMISIEGNVGNTMLVGPRYLFALASDGYGPGVLARVHPRYHTPAAAIHTQAVASVVLALSGSFVRNLLACAIALVTGAVIHYFAKLRGSSVRRRLSSARIQDASSPAKYQSCS